MATVIQTGPSGWDIAAQAFQQAFQNGQQLALKRKELELQAQRVQSATDLEAAQRRQIEQDLQQKAGQHQADDAANNAYAGLASLHPELLSDPVKMIAAVAPQLSQIPGATESFAGLMKGHTEILSGAAQRDLAIQRAAVDQATAAHQERENLLDGQVHDILSHYEGQDLAHNPQTQAKAIADIFTVDPERALRQADTFNKINGRVTTTALDDGSILTADEQGHWHVTAHAWGGRPAAGGPGAQMAVQQRLVAARQTVNALQKLNAIYLMDHEGVVEPPAATTLEDAKGVLGRVLGGGAGMTTAQAVRSKHQQLAGMYGAQFIDQYFKTIVGGNTPRNREYWLNFRRAYVPIGPLKEGVGEAAYRSRLELIADLQQLIRSASAGQAPDPSLVHGFSDAINAETQVQQLVDPSGAGVDLSQRPWEQR